MGPITGSGTVRPGPGFTVRFALFTWTSALLSRHEVTPKIHRRTSMAYVTWKLVFLYDNNKSIYLNKYPYTMGEKQDAAAKDMLHKITGDEEVWVRTVSDRVGKK